MPRSAPEICSSASVRALWASQPAADPTLVTIDTGTVRGVSTGSVISFRGIPYAAPPVGDLRWRAPQPVKHWQSVRAADKFGPECMQTDNVSKAEDCLTLNVWRPAGRTDPLPVMVWILRRRTRSRPDITVPRGRAGGARGHRRQHEL
jgi:para-nitrobenzyl esterase